jgi:hypothetical protein
MQTTLCHLCAGQKQAPPLSERLTSLGTASIPPPKFRYNRAYNNRALYPKWDTRWLTLEEEQQYKANLARWQTQEEHEEPALGTVLQQATLVRHVAQHRLQSLRVPARLFPGLQAAAAGGGTGRWSLLTNQEDEAYTANLSGWRAQAATEAGAEWLSLGELSRQAKLELIEDYVDVSPPPPPLADLSKVEQWASLKAGKDQGTCELQEWRAEAAERRPAVLAKRGAQIAAAVGLAYPLPGPVPAPPEDSDDEWDHYDDPDWQAYNTDQLRRSFFKQFVSIAANDPDETSLYFEEYESDPLTMPGRASGDTEHVSALLACIADCLAGNTFMKRIVMCLSYHQYAWAAASHAQFRRLVTAVQHSRLIYFETPHISFFNHPNDVSTPGPDCMSDHPGKFSVVAAGTVVALQHAVDHNRNRPLYRSFQRMLLRALHERPSAGPTGAVAHALSGVGLPFSADLLEMVCERLNRCCFAAPLTALADLPAFAWRVVPETAAAAAAAAVGAGAGAASGRGRKRARSPEVGQ